MGDFLDVAHDLLLSGRIAPNHRGNFAKVFRAISALQSVHSKAKLDTYNVESVFTTLELAHIIRKLPGIDAQEIPETIESLKTDIAQTLELKIRFPAAELTILAPVPYGDFARLIWHVTKDSARRTLCRS